MNNNKEYFTEIEALELIKEALEWFNQSDYSELHSEAFNTDYYIIGTHEAKQALEQYGTFDAIELITQYELNNFGELYTDLSEPERVANMLMYLIGEKAMIDNEDIFNFINDNEPNKENNNELIKIVNQTINQFNN